MRGNPVGLAPYGKAGGSIPAYAGEPPLPLLDGVAVTVYPRVCGGTVTAAQFCLVGVGLSPRMRGNPSSTTTSATCPRSIPAYAGEPH